MVSQATTTALQSITDNHGILELLLIDHASFASPVRLVNDTRDWTIGADTYIGLPFRLKLPKQTSKENPRAQIQIDNIGREITSLLEGLPVGSSMLATIRIVGRSTPTVVDYEFVSPMSSISVTATVITATIGPDDSMRGAAVRVRYDPTNAPGLFSG